MGAVEVICNCRNEMIRVLFLTNNLGNGGAERVLVNLVNKMTDDDYNVTVRLLTDSGQNRQFLSSKVHYEYVFAKSFRGLNYLNKLPRRWIYKKVAHGNYDLIVVYLHGVLTKIVSYAPKSQKTIACLHANMEKSPFIKSFRNQDAIQKCFAGYSRIVSVSEDVQKSFVRVSGINDSRLVVKYNTFDVDAIIEKASAQIKKGHSNGKMNLCSVGKLETIKGYDRLLRVVHRLYNEGFDFHLTLVGEGPQRNELESFIMNNGLNDVVEFVGFDANPYKYLAKSDLFVCSSISEGFSSVVAESLILGVPVITTNCAGMKEMLGENNEYGVIVDNDEDGLYNGLKNLLSDLDLLKHYRNQAQARSSFFSPETTVGEFERMIKEVINEQ